MATRVVLARCITEKYTFGEVENGSGLPCGRAVTGFWSKDPIHTVNLLVCIEEEMMQKYGGGVWPRELAVLITDEDDLVEAVPPPGAKTRHVDAFDGSEVFAIQVRAYTWMYWMDWLRTYSRPDARKILESF